jgi:uncharacterized membrane protein YcaP (DUF421 family)
MDSQVLTNMFHLGLPVAEKIVRPVVVYVFLVIGLRLAGKRELAQLNTFDLVVLLLLSNVVQNAIIGEDNSVTGGLVGAATLLGLNHLVVRFLYRHERLDRVIEGEADVLIDGGRILEERLANETITVAELEVAARKQGFSSLAAVDRAVLEAGGGISFVVKKPEPEEIRHKEVLARLDLLASEMAALKAGGAGLAPSR